MDASERTGEGERLDQALVARGLAASRTLAQRLVKSGEVEVDGRVETRPACRVRGSQALRVRALPRYVSRGGEKLAAALAAFRVDPTGLAALDAGSSTGGFTDCLLQHGAREVHALDVGHGQLAASLRADPRVISLEGVDLRDWKVDLRFPLLVADLSFIPSRLVLPALGRLGASDARWIVLVKPQFEVGQARLPKDGVVKEPRDHLHALRGALDAAAESGLACRAMLASPIAGGEGNREFLALFERGAGHAPLDLERLVRRTSEA